MNDVIQKCEQALERHYGEQFRGLVLYGSMARHQADDSSDIDLLVLLSGSFDYFAELQRIVDVLYPVQLESNLLISAKPVAIEEFEAGRVALYRIAKREGVEMWT
jgi:predicted nucleotidyltransferase